MKAFKTIGAFIFLSFLTLLSGCSKDDDGSSSKKQSNNNDGNSDYHIEANLAFSSGETMDYKANSVIPFDEPFIKDENSPHRIVTAAYQITIDDLIYRFDFKTLVKEEPGQYDMYTKSEDKLDTLGVYFEFTVESKMGSGGTVDDLYRTQYVSNESGELKITSITQDRLKGTFSAVLPYMPLEKGKNLTITNGKIDIPIKWMN